MPVDKFGGCGVGGGKRGAAGPPGPRGAAGEIGPPGAKGSRGEKEIQVPREKVENLDLGVKPDLKVMPGHPVRKVKKEMLEREVKLDKKVKLDQKDREVLQGETVLTFLDGPQLLH